MKNSLIATLYTLLILAILSGFTYCLILFPLLGQIFMGTIVAAMVGFPFIIMGMSIKEELDNKSKK